MLKFLTIATIILLIIFIPIITYYVSLVQQREQIKEQVLALSKYVKPIIVPKKSELPEIINTNFSAYGNDYAVVVRNLKTGEEYRFNDEKKYNSASLYKLWVMAVAFQKIKDGTLKEDSILTGQAQKLDNALSTVSPTPTPEGFVQAENSEEEKLVSMTVNDALEKMITLSDNYAALLLASKVGASSITDFQKSYGLTNSNFKQPPKTTASDVALFYKLLYEGQIVDIENSQKMIEILKRQTINDRIPKNLPDNIQVAHKTGELFGSKHDGGIVFSESGDYIIIVLSDTKDPREAVKNIANFSREIYDYFELSKLKS